MKIISYEYSANSPQNKLSIQKFELGDINLLAGLSAVGKTRILNTIYNLSLIIQKKRVMGVGKWEIDFLIDKVQYTYFLDLQKDTKSGKVIVKKEILKRKNKDIFTRNLRKFLFKGNDLPFSKEDIGLFLLREEKKIMKVYEEFSKIYIRRLNPDYYYKPEHQLAGISKKLLYENKEKFTLTYIQNNFIDVNIQLFFIKEYHKETFKQIESDLKDIFPFVLKIDIRPINEIEGLEISSPIPLDIFIPIIMLKEIKIKNSIPVVSISSGMLRALIQLVDIYTMPENSIYLIDELENSMGIKSFPVMFDILKSKSNKIQLIFTTHHPYIFHNINVKNWKVLTRKGNIVRVIDGKVLTERFSKSHLDSFTQLINSELIESGI